jgi:hypothetical protein
MAATDQIRQMVNFILQEAHEKANEIRVKVCSKFALNLILDLGAMAKQVLVEQGHTVKVMAVVRLILCTSHGVYSLQHLTSTMLPGIITMVKSSR